MHAFHVSYHIFVGYWSYLPKGYICLHIGCCSLEVLPVVAAATSLAFHCNPELLSSLVPYWFSSVVENLQSLSMVLNLSEVVLTHSLSGNQDHTVSALTNVRGRGGFHILITFHFDFILKKEYVCMCSWRKGWDYTWRKVCRFLSKRSWYWLTLYWNFLLLRRK